MYLHVSFFRYDRCMTEKKKNTKYRKKKSRIRFGRLAVVAAGVLIPVGLLFWGVSAIFGKKTDNSSKETEQTNKTQEVKTAAKKTEKKKQACTPADGYDKCFTFTGVGDNLIHETLYEGDDEYKVNRDFSQFYENIAPYFKNSDLAYINFETLCAGDEFGFSGYPDFNAPKEIIDALDDAGANWFSLASNHCLDRYPEGLLAELKDIEENHPDVTYTGVYSSPEASQKPVILDINGIKVGLATFAYGLNGRDKPEGYEWMIDTFQDNNGVMDYELIDKRLEDLKANSDVQIVSMHWGTEYANEINDLQAILAQYLNERGVDVIIGTHPHVIEPVEYLNSETQSTLIYYSLGNFLSNQADMQTMVGGMAQFQVNLNSKTGHVLITDPTFTPTITWFDVGDHNFKGTTIHEYTPELAASHGLTGDGHDMTLERIIGYVQSIVGQPDGIQVVLDPNEKKN